MFVSTVSYLFYLDIIFHKAKLRNFSDIECLLTLLYIAVTSWRKPVTLCPRPLTTYRSKATSETPSFLPFGRSYFVVDRKAVDSMLSANSGKRVNVLIDSLGGSLATGMSISAAFRAIDSGDVRNYIQKHYPNESFYPHNEDDD